MNLLNELLEEVGQFSQEWNNGELTTEERNLKIDLVIGQVGKLQLNYGQPSLNAASADGKKVLANLLSKYKLKAKIALNSLKEIESKSSYNRKTRYIIDKKLFFSSLIATIRRSLTGWIDKNNHKQDELNLFIYEITNKKGTEENE